MRAMEFARQAHAGQVRKYTGNPYFDHLAEVTGIAMSSGWPSLAVHPDDYMATCWLHDCAEDQGVPIKTLRNLFGAQVALGVEFLSDIGKFHEKHIPRAQRKASSIDRLKDAPGWVQTIKAADIASNLSSIAQHDPDFAKVYLAEKQAQLAALARAEPTLVQMAATLADPSTEHTNVLTPAFPAF